MKKLLYVFAVLNLTGTSMINVNAKIKNNDQNLQVFATINKAEANEFGDLHYLVPNTSHRYHWCLRFYMTPAIYNMLLLTAEESWNWWRWHSWWDPMSRFYKLFLGDESEQSYPTWYSNAIIQYNEIIKQYDAFYHVDFNNILKLWLQKNYKYFYNVFWGKTFHTNIYDYPSMPHNLTPEERETFLQKKWRKTGIVMNIPFLYNQDLTTQNKWAIDVANLRIFPQIKGINPLFYYYNVLLEGESNVVVPRLLLPNEAGVSSVSATDPRVKRDILRAFFSALNPPQKLRERHYYSVEQSSLRDKEIHVYNPGGYPTLIRFKFGLLAPSGEPYSKIFRVGFYLTTPPK